MIGVDRQRLTQPLDRPLGLAEPRAQQVAHLEQHLGPRVGLLDQRLLGLVHVEQIAPALGLLVQARQRRQRLPVGPDLVVDLIVGRDRLVGVLEHLLEQPRHAQVDLPAHVLGALDHRPPPEHLDQLAPALLALVEPLEAGQRAAGRSRRAPSTSRNMPIAFARRSSSDSSISAIRCSTSSRSVRIAGQPDPDPQRRADPPSPRWRSAADRAPHRGQRCLRVVRIVVEQPAIGHLGLLDVAEPLVVELRHVGHQPRGEHGIVVEHVGDHRVEQSTVLAFQTVLVGDPRHLRGHLLVASARAGTHSTAPRTRRPRRPAGAPADQRPGSGYRSGRPGPARRPRS